MVWLDIVSRPTEMLALPAVSLTLKLLNSNCTFVSSHLVSRRSTSRLARRNSGWPSGRDRCRVPKSRRRHRCRKGFANAGRLARAGRGSQRRRSSPGRGGAETKLRRRTLLSQGVGVTVVRAIRLRTPRDTPCCARDPRSPCGPANTGPKHSGLLPSPAGSVSRSWLRLGRRGCLGRRWPPPGRQHRAGGTSEAASDGVGVSATGLVAGRSA
jgi:hypothetical protein